MKIIDNFLDIESFTKIQQTLLSGNINWFYSNYTNNVSKHDQFYFNHHFYERFKWVSPQHEIINPLLAKINPIAIHNIRANLTTRSENIIESDYHVDLTFIKDKNKLSQWTTSIFYINNNDGYTKLSDETIVESKSNRLLIMSSDTQHLGTTCTNQKRRIVINLNYFV
jgi:hypothetical protein